VAQSGATEHCVSRLLECTREVPRFGPTSEATAGRTRSSQIRRQLEDHRAFEDRHVCS
jgi:hypothetical protein